MDRDGHGKFAIHATRKRLIQVQRERKAQDEPFRAFEVLDRFDAGFAIVEPRRLQ